MADSVGKRRRFPFCPDGDRHAGPFRFVAQKQAPHLVIIFPGRLLSDHALIHEAAWRAADSHLPFICL